MGKTGKYMLVALENKMLVYESTTLHFREKFEVSITKDLEIEISPVFTVSDSKFNTLLVFVKSSNPLVSGDDTLQASFVGDNSDFVFNIPHTTFISLSCDGTLLAASQEKVKIYFFLFFLFFFYFYILIIFLLIYFF